MKTMQQPQEEKQEAKEKVEEEEEEVVVKEDEEDELQRHIRTLPSLKSSNTAKQSPAIESDLPYRIRFSLSHTCLPCEFALA